MRSVLLTKQNATAFCFTTLILHINFNDFQARLSESDPQTVITYVFRSSSWGDPLTPDWSTWTLTVCSDVSAYGRWYESLPHCCWSVESSLWQINSGESLHLQVDYNLGGILKSTQAMHFAALLCRPVFVVMVYLFTSCSVIYLVCDFVLAFKHILQ